jgi:hypothetical protein
MRGTDHERITAVFVRELDADSATAEADPSDLPDSLVAERARNVDGREEVGIPPGLRARGPGRKLCCWFCGMIPPRASYIPVTVV